MKSGINRREAVKCMMAGALLPNAVLLASCNEGKSPTSEKLAAAAVGPVKAEKTAQWAAKPTGLSLVDRLNMATLRRGGVFIDFGTTDYFKYTLGKWRTGWGRNTVKEGVSFTSALGTTGRIYFPWYAKTDAVFKIRLAARKAKIASVYINNKPLSKIDFKSQDWASYSLTIPKSMLTPGDNYLLLRWGNDAIAANDAAAWVDYIHFEEAGAKAGDAAPLPTQQSIAATADLSDEEKKVPAITLYPGFTLSYYLQIPDAGLKPELGFYMKAPRTGKAGTPAGPGGKLSLKAVSDKNQEVELLKEDVAGGSPKTFDPRGIDLAALGGQIVRLDVALEAPPAAPFKVTLAKPAIYVEGKNFDKPPAVVRGKDRKTAKSAILLMIDTLRADHTHCYGAKNIKTPVLDRLAEEGAMFERFSAVEDWTKPSCATMLTGLYPNTHKAQTESAVLSKSVAMVSEEMKSRGLTTGAFIANGYISEKFGFKRGWDYYENYIREKKPTEAEHVFHKAAEWIDKVRDKRFFAYIHTIDPHVPYSPPEDFIKLYDSKPYDGPIKPRMSHVQLEEIKKGSLKVSERDKQRIEALYKGEISYHDKYLGSFMQRMADMGLLEDTLLIITADHGEEFWEHGSVGHGHSIFQELVHVPFVVFWKGVVPAGRRVADNHDHAVIVPTLMDGLSLDAPDYLEGTSILPKAVGLDEKYPHAGFSTHQNERMGVWSDRVKLQMNGPVNTYLYDMAKDPDCKNNVYKNHPVSLRYMRTLLGLFMGSPDRKDWKSTALLAEKQLDVKVEEVEWDDELKKQLQKLGYVNE
jgi:choline-sulfatase